MSFFGFNTDLPRDRGHPVNAPGFGQAPDPFASISRKRPDQNVEEEAEDDDAYVSFPVPCLFD
jgi:DNA topoisomerase 2-associated protein PAT1